MSALLASFDAILSDLDGVVYAGPDPIDGAVESLNRAQEGGTAVAYVTNNASRSVDDVAEHLNELGLSTDGEHVVSSAQSAARLAVERLGEGAAVHVCGAPALARCAEQAGLRVAREGERPRAVLQGFSPELGWRDLAEAAYLLADSDVAWIASNTDMTIPKERGIAPGNGTLVAAVAAATRREPLIAGKPGAAIFHEIAERLGASRPVVLGDRLDTDILGAHQAGLPSIAVLTGVQTPEDLLNARTAERPTYVIEDLRRLFVEYAAPEVTASEGGARARVGDRASAVADAGTVTIEAERGSMDGWRAGMSAWWAAHPEEDSATGAEVRWR